MEQATVLIITDDPEFTRVITSRWQSERNIPAFTVMSSHVQLGFDPDNFQLAIVGGIENEAISVVLEALVSARKRVVFTSADLPLLQTVRNRWPGVLGLRQQEGWLETLVLVGVEAIHRMNAEERALEAENSRAQLQHDATLGRYILDMRHTLNNTLTAMLGNSELLLLEPGSLSAEARAQIETIRHMALRIHEVLQRFSSLEKELTVLDQEAKTRRATGSLQQSAAVQ